MRSGGGATSARSFEVPARAAFTTPLQAPGVAILDAGAVARWVWRGRTLGDYPPLGAVLERLRSLPGRG
jgi:hypothetical protein